MRTLLLVPVLALFASSPSAAQNPDSVILMNINTILDDLWGESLRDAAVVAWTLDEAAAASADASLPPDGRVSAHRRALLTAAIGAAGAAGTLAATGRLPLLRDESLERQPATSARLEMADDLYILLVQTAEEAGDAALALPETEIDASPEGIDFDVADTPETWRQRASLIREITGRLQEVVLGTDPTDE